MEDYDFEHGVTELPLLECGGANDITFYNKFTNKYTTCYRIRKILVNPDSIRKIIFPTYYTWSRFRYDYLSIEEVIYKYDIIEHSTLINGTERNWRINILEFGYDDNYYVIASRVDMNKEEDMSDMNKLTDEYNNVTHPYHYTQGGIECIDAIKASMTKEEFKGFLKGNSLKYLWRYENKNNPVEDLEKAKWYLEKLISESGNNDES